MLGDLNGCGLTGVQSVSQEIAQMVRVPIPSLSVNLMLCLNTR
jgi:hypothetical protein